MEEPKEPSRPLNELHAEGRFRLVQAITSTELLLTLAPFCDPMLSVLRDDLRAALAALTEAAVIDELMAQLVTGTPRWSE